MGQNRSTAAAKTPVPITFGISNPGDHDRVTLGERFDDALLMASELHRTQYRKFAPEAPYLAHLMGVTSLVLENGGNGTEAIAAVLHDAVEDQGGAPILAEIRQKFGDTVANIVDGCSDADVIPKPPWKERKEAYLAHLSEAPRSVLLVSACDKLYNARSLVESYRQYGESLWAGFKGGRKGTLWYFDQLSAAYANAGYDTPATQELKRTIQQLKRLVFFNRAAAFFNRLSGGRLFKNAQPVQA